MKPTQLHIEQSVHPPTGRSGARTGDKGPMRTGQCAWVVLVLLLAGCASHRPELSLAHDVGVPQAHRRGNFSPEHPGYMAGNSAIERYVNAYERGWWACVRKYGHDIRYQLQPADAAGLGWPEEADGWSDGFTAASNRIQNLIANFGEQRVTTYLAQFVFPQAEPPTPASPRLRD